jgi:hypothetical protein
MTIEEVLALIQGGENLHVELKASGARPGELAERMCGLAIIYNQCLGTRCVRGP